MPIKPFASVCALCGGNVRLEEAKIDSYGQTVHEDCIVDKMIQDANGPTRQQSPARTARSWTEIANELAVEPDPERALKLADELNRALDSLSSSRAKKLKTENGE